MKKAIAAVAIVTGLLLALRFMGRSPLPDQHPIKQPATAVPDGNGTADLDAILASIERWKAVPDLRLLAAKCEASPKDKVGEMPKQASPAPTPSRALTRLLEEVLCSGDLEDCARIESMERPSELGPAQPGRAFMTKQWCMESVVAALRVRSLAEDGPGRTSCREWLSHYLDPNPRPEEVSLLCEMLESDSSTCGRLDCSALRAMNGSDDREYERCLDRMHFIKGEQACVDALKDPLRRDYCLSLARVYSAARSRDVSKCREKTFPGIKSRFEGADPSCLAVMRDPPTCTAEDGVAAAKKKWIRGQCPAWAIEQVQAWVRDVDANARFAIDQLPKEKRRLASLGPERSHDAPRIDAAMRSAQEALKSMEAIRDKMNKGLLPGQGPSGPGG